VLVCSTWQPFRRAIGCNNALNSKQYGKVFPAIFHGRKMRGSSFLRLYGVDSAPIFIALNSASRATDASSCIAKCPTALALRVVRL